MGGNELCGFMHGNSYNDPVLGEFTPEILVMNASKMKFVLFDEDEVEFQQIEVEGSDVMGTLEKARKALLAHIGYPELVKEFKWAEVGLLQLAVKDPLGNWRFAGRIKVKEASPQED